MSVDKLPDSALVYVLKALIPYTEANLKLSFKPSAFFYDLEKISRSKHSAIKTAFYRAEKRGLIEIDDSSIPRLTKKGMKRIKPYVAKVLGKGASLLVIFDIPEVEAWKRRHLRSLLYELGFKQVQKSVWQTQYDHRELIAAEIKQYGLENCVQLYEAAKLA